MIRTILTIVIGLCLVFPASAQKKLNWKGHLKEAERLYAAGKLAKAAENYESAWKKKTTRKN